MQLFWHVLITFLTHVTSQRTDGSHVYGQVTWSSRSTIQDLFGIHSCAVHPVSREYSRTIHPWTYPPVCSGARSSDGDTICVFTDDQFNSGRGISVITTFGIAEMLSESPLYVEDCHDSENANGVTSAVSASDRGLRTTRDFLSRERVVTNRGVIMMHPSFFNLSWLEREELLRVAVSQLPRTTQERILNLSSPPEQVNLYLADKIWSHSGFHAVVGRKKHNMLFPEVALINHSCTPNAFVVVNATSFAANVVAARDIGLGEEITISYLLGIDDSIHLLTFRERQDRLYDKLQFSCMCSDCQFEENSDPIREQILTRARKLLVKEKMSQDELEEALELYNLFQAAGLDALIHKPSKWLSRVYSSLGQHVQAKYWNDQAMEIQQLNGQLIPASQARAAWAC